MEKTDYPSITRYRHHFMAIYHSRDNLALTAAGESIQATVPVDHIELPMLVAAGQQKRQELAQDQEKAS